MSVQNKPGQVASDADGIPMQKSNPMIFVGIGGAVLLLGGALLWASSGDDDTERKAAEIKAKAAAVGAQPEGMTAKEQAEHLKRTQLALEHLKETADEKKKAAEAAAAAEAEKAVAAAPAGEPASGSGDNSGAAPAPKPAKPVSKKDLDGLDSIGSDVAAGLK